MGLSALSPPRFSRPLRGALSLAALIALGGCASWPRSLGRTPCCIHTKPVVKRQPIWWHLFDVTVLEPVEQPLHLLRFGRKLLGVPMRSVNLRERQLSASTFLMSVDPAPLTPEQVRWGPSRPEDEPQPPLTVTKPKLEGKTPGFFVRDTRGVRYLLKLDPVESPELLSGSEVVASKLVYALGYRVPSYEIVSVKADDLRVDAGAAHGLTPERLRGLLEPRLRGGSFRAVASKIVEGEILGPAKFKAFRDCAEVRALKVAYAWLNNVDSKDHNSLLVWDGTRTMGYLMDFGTSLGADAGLGGPKTVCEGWLNEVDLKHLSAEVLTLGLHRHACEPRPVAVSPAVGLFSPSVNPDRWKPYAPNVAFDAMDAEDARWIARRMAALSREQIAAAVSAGRYSHPEDAVYLVNALDQRRRLIVARYLNEEQEEEAEEREEREAKERP